MITNNDNDNTFSFSCWLTGWRQFWISPSSCQAQLKSQQLFFFFRDFEQVWTTLTSWTFSCKNASINIVKMLLFSVFLRIFSSCSPFLTGCWCLTCSRCSAGREGHCQSLNILDPKSLTVITMTWRRIFNFHTFLNVYQQYRKLNRN